MKDIDEKVIRTIRFLSADAIEKAKSGHPGLPMGTATMAYTLWSRFLKSSYKDPQWIDRDRFVLSAGHGSMLLYSLLHLFGYDLSLEDLMNFRQWGSKTPGHPEYDHTPGVDTTTGPLGQGFGNAVGMAMAERRLSEEFNTSDFNIIDHYTYVIAGDGDMMEGVTSEAASFAGHHKLGKLIVMYDDNKITIDGSTDITFTEDVGKRFEAYGWEIIRVNEGNDVGQIEEALKKARMNLKQPSLIIVPTIIGYGSPNKAGKSAAHGAPLGEEELRLTKEQYDWHENPDFHIPDDVKEHMKELVAKWENGRNEWEEKYKRYGETYPEKAKELERWLSNEMPEEFLEDKELWSFKDKPEATRSSGGKVINIVSKYYPNLMGGSADLDASTKTYLKDKGDFQWENPKGNNVHFGVREHGMGAVLNGMALHGGLRVFGSTFLVFADYMRPSIRMAALMKLPVIYIFTHDSIAVGEDGPTHQPIEHVMSLRIIPNVTVFRPGDAKETAVAWIEALKKTDGPSVIVLTRQNLPLLEGVHRGAHSGGYILKKEDGDKADMILIATGSEVSLAVEAQNRLKKEEINARVVSMISWEQFNSQTEAYRNEVLPPNVRKRLTIEAGSTAGWRSFAGDEGRTIGIDHFGTSGPGEVLMEKYGFNVDNVVNQVKEMMK